MTTTTSTPPSGQHPSWSPEQWARTQPHAFFSHWPLASRTRCDWCGVYAGEHPAAPAPEDDVAKHPTRALRCMRSEPHELGPSCWPEVRDPAVGAYIEIETRRRTGTERAVVLVTSAEQREGYVYVGWRNVQPGGGWDRRLGAWGFFRSYAEPREFGTTVVRQVPA